jgi:protein-disulfide isomerase
MNLLLIFSGKDEEISIQGLNKNKNLVDETKLYQNIADDPQIGKREAKVRVVEFTDFECPYCQQVFSTVREIIAKYGEQIYFVYRDFPVSDIHPEAEKAAEASNCAQEQGKFWPMHDKLFINQNDLSLSSLKRYAQEIGLEIKAFNNCLNTGKYLKEVEQDYLDGQKLGVKGTPTFFINGYRISGVIPRDLFITLIEKGLSE